LALLLSVTGGLGGAESARVTPANDDVSLKAVVEFETTARLLAVLLDSGRNVVNENLLMAEPQSTDVGLSTSSAGNRPDGDRPVPRALALSPDFTASLFERQLADTFFIRSGVDLRTLSSARLPPGTKTLLRQLAETSKAVVAEARAGTTQNAGTPTVHLIPAVFGSRVARQFASATGVQLKQTALVPRNPANMPDEFERWALREFAEPGYQREKVITEVTAKSKMLRLMFPLYATRYCLACHGEPRGEADQLGYSKEGLKLGQNAGAISVIMPIQP
jgi:general secretion pathway protein A